MTFFLTYIAAGAVIAEWFERTHEDHPWHWVGVLCAGFIWPITVVLMIMFEWLEPDEWPESDE